MRRTLLCATLALVFGAAPALADAAPDVSRVNGGITAEAGERYGDLETVNGGISVGKGAVVDDVGTVNGGIRLGDDARVGTVGTVNGGIRAGERVIVGGGAETVNGGIRFGFNSRVQGDVETVNGGITLQQTEVGGSVSTVGGDIVIGARSRVRGGIVVEKPTGLRVGWGKRDIPRIVIGPNAVVDGPLRFERKVELFVHPSARIGSVSGATAQPWSDTLPPRQRD